ncbi:hypothetical protein [Niabella ginsengisoli]|uniref:Uncharacterized protein n=1 Tax=Niabella ginsengisoli TaxID=522298 RepID=A0ABS9SMG7_9BACT|nr:hypothetical protein [Niabella ginsengisoli]MCH5599580.1 hypothetical protein [Niabella ginsengisoli]
MIEITAGPALNTYKYSDSKIFGNNYLWRYSDNESSFAITVGALAGVNINL